MNLVAALRSQTPKEERGLLILPDLWKTQKDAFPTRSLDGANGCAAHRLNRPCCWSVS